MADHDRYRATITSEDGQVATNAIDRYIATIIRRESERSSRRAFLTRIGKLAVAIAGGTLAAGLPADRRVVLGNHAGSCCNEWQYCGIMGWPCKHCPGGSSDTSCPLSGCTTAGAGWTACCDQGGGSCSLVTYLDCCKPIGSQWWECQDFINDCSCHCGPGGTDIWCNAGRWQVGGDPANYRCTLAIVSGSCGGC